MGRWEAAAAVLVVAVLALVVVDGATTWCVARSNARQDALQVALDYACASGADCAPIQPNGLCYLPNTMDSHSSYAFNSYYQRRSMAPASCDFSGTAYISMTDPSYGSCVYPTSLSNAGGGPAAPGMPMNNPNSPIGPDTGGGAGGGVGVFTPETPSTDNDNTSSSSSSSRLPSATILLISITLRLLVVFSFLFSGFIALVQ